MKTVLFGILFSIVGLIYTLTMLHMFAPQYLEPHITTLIGFVCGFVGTEIAIRIGL